MRGPPSWSIRHRQSSPMRSHAAPTVFGQCARCKAAPFFNENGLLYLPASEVARLTDGLIQADPLLQTLAADPSLRGSLSALSLGLTGVQYGQIRLDDLAPPMTMASDTVQEALAGRPASFSWRAFASGKPPEPQELRRFIEVEPVLDYSALQPGRAASDAVMQTERELNLDSDYQARVRLTGLVPMNDDQFATINPRSISCGRS